MNVEEINVVRISRQDKKNAWKVWNISTNWAS
jgi:hypothetical protein